MPLPATSLPPDEDPLLHLPRSVYWQVVHDLHKALPAPDPDDDTPDAQAHRIQAAIAEVACMLPANANEASIATRCVAAHAQAMDNLRLARRHPDDSAHVLRCSAQSASMMRTANSARALLLRVQAVREKREANPAACDQALWVEHAAAGLMLHALRDPAAEPAPPPPEPTTVPQPEPAALPPPEQAAAEPSSHLTEAEAYAVHYPRRAALIRAHGGLPDNCSFGPPEPSLVEALLGSASPLVLAFDRPAAAAFA